MKIKMTHKRLVMAKIIFSHDNLWLFSEKINRSNYEFRWDVAYQVMRELRSEYGLSYEEAIRRLELMDDKGDEE